MFGLQLQLPAKRSEANETADSSSEERANRLDATREHRDALRAERDELRERVDALESTVAEKDRRLRDLEGSLAELQGVAEANAAGDLTRRVKIESDVEAVVAFTSTYNRMLDEWNETLKRVTSFASRVERSTAAVDEQLTDLQADSEQVTQSVTEIVDGTDTQKQRLDEISQEMAQLSGTTEEIAAAADTVAEMSAQAVDRSEESQTAATTAIDRLDQMSTQTAETMAQIEQLQRRSRDIEEITEFITQVAEQTDMLALNANIEAARSGNSEGFGVVAEEIKQLASETTAATDRIEQSVTEIRAETDRTVSDMEATSEAVTESKTAVTTALDGLDTVAETVAETNQQIADIDGATDEQARSTQEISGRVDDVAEISRETTTQAHAARDAAQSQHTALTAVNDEVTELSERADALSQTTDEFTTGERERRSIRNSETVVRFHHAMGGARALLLQDMAEEFEQQTDGIRIKPVSMGSYPAALQSVIDVSADERPALAQVYDIGTATAQASDCFQPAENLVSASTLDSIVDSVRGYYDIDSRLYSVPFNSSNPILCYNEAAFEAAGLDPTNPPATLGELRSASKQLCARTDCTHGVSFAIYSWFVEQWFAEADQLLINADNGRRGAPSEAFLDSEFAKKLFEWWVEMEEDDLYHNPGIHGHSAALEAFHRGDAAMFLGSTASLDRIRAGADFPLGTASFPVLGDRHGVLVGGASLWVKRGLDPEIETALGEFLEWLLTPDQQARWHRETGYFPVVDGAIERLEANGWFEQNPEFATAFRQFQESTDTPATNGARIEQFPEVRDLIHEARDRMATTEDVEPVLAETNDRTEALLQSKP